MALPTTPIAFPTPVGFPEAVPPPLFGITPEEQELQALGNITGAAPTVLNGLSVPEEQKVGSWLALNSAIGGALEDDPRDWAPEEAAAQTDRALARIAVANPALAQSIAAQRGQAAEAGEDLPWWKDILHGVGTFLEVTHLDDLLEVVGRPARIIPEIIMDWGEESVWKNMGDAISGNSQANWSDVLVEKLGMERSKLTAVLGFVGDVATDPLTWATFGLGGVGRAAASTAVGKAALRTKVAEAGSTAMSGMRNELAQAIGRNAADVTDDMLVAALYNSTDIGRRFAAKGGEGVKGLLARIKQLTGGVHDDAVGGVIDWTVSTMDTTLFRDLIRATDRGYTMSSVHGWQRVTADAAAKYGLDKAAIDRVLKAQVRAGSGFVKKAAYTEGKQAAAALGGWRLRGSFKPFGLRVAGARIPLMPRNLDFSMGRRFFAGLSGHTRLMKMVGSGQAPALALDVLYKGGYSALKKRFPDVARQLSKGSLHGGSIFYPLSEQIGGVTAHFTSHAMQLRGGGLAAKIAGDIKTQTKHVKQGVSDEILTILRSDGTVLSPDAAMDKVVQFQRATRKAGLDDEEVAGLMEDVDRLLPNPDLSAAQQWDERIATLTGDPVDYDALTAAKQHRQEAIELEARLKAMGMNAEEVAHVRRAWGHQHDTALQRANLMPDSADDAIEDIDEIHPEDARVEQGRGHEAVRDVDFVADGDVGMGALDASSFRDSSTGQGVIARGLHLVSRPAAEVDDAQVIKGGQLDEAIRDMTGGAGSGMFAGPIDDPLAKELSKLVKVEDDAWFAAQAEVGAAKASGAPTADVTNVARVEEAFSTVEGLAKYAAEGGDFGVQATAYALQDAGAAHADVMAMLAGDVEAAKRIAAAIDVDTLAEILKQGQKRELKALSKWIDLGESPALDAAFGGGGETVLGRLDRMDRAEQLIAEGADVSDINAYLRKELTQHLRDDVAELDLEDLIYGNEEAARAIIGDATSIDQLDDLQLAKLNLVNAGIDAEGIDDIDDALKLLLEAERAGIAIGGDRLLADTSLGMLGEADNALPAVGSKADAEDFAIEEEVRQLVGDDVVLGPDDMQKLTDKYGAEMAEQMRAAIEGRKALPAQGGTIKDVTLGDIKAAVDRAAAHSGGDADAMLREVQQQLNMTGRASATPEAPYQELDFARPPSVAARPMNPLRRDVSTGGEGAAVGREATDIIDEYDEVVAQYTKFLERVKQGEIPQELDDDVVEELQRIISKEGAFEEQLSEAVTNHFRNKGHDSILTKTDDGYELVMFPRKEGGNAVAAARINPAAPRLNYGLGAAQRQVSAGVLDSVGNMSGGEALIRKLLRASAKMPRKQADNYIRTELRKLGHELLPGESALESDLLVIARTRADRASSRATAQYMGQAANQVENIGLARNAWGTGPVGVGRFKYVVTDVGRDALKEMGAEVNASARRVAAFSRDNDMPRIQAEAEATAQAVARMEKHLDDVIEDADGVRAEAASLREARERTDEALGGRAEAMSEVEVARFTAEKQVQFEAALKAGKVTKLTRNIQAFDSIGGQKRYFVYADPNTGKVLGWAEVNKPDWDTALGVDMPFRKSVRPELNVAQELIDEVFKETGIDSAEKVARFVANNTFSHGGSKLVEGKLDQLAQDFVKAARQKLKDAAKEAKRKKAVLDDTRLQHAEIVAEQQRILARMQTERAPALAALVPVQDAKTMTGMSEVHGLPGFEGMAMPAFMAEEFRSALAGFPKLNDAHAQYRRFHSWWKEWATYMNPGFHIRNTMGAYFNNWLGGVDMNDYFTMSRIRKAERELYSGGKIGGKGKWAKTKVMQKDADLIHALERGGTFTLNGKNVRELTYADLAHVTGEMNVTASNGRAFAEARLSVDEIERRAEGSRLMEKIPLVKKYPEFAKGVGTMTENSFRTAAWVRGVRDTGSVTEARAFTMLRHGDYEDLTDWEYGLIRDVLPFYKWMRTNTPYQVHQLFEAPGKLLAAQKAQGAAFEAQGRDYDKDKYLLPDWMRESIIVPTGVEGPNPDDAWNAVMLDLPMSDLYFSTRDFFSQFAPLVKPFIESYIYEESTFTGAPLEDKPVELHGGVAAALTPVMPMLKAMGVVKENEGKEFITDKTQNLMSLIPTFSRFRNFMFADPARVKLRGNALASAFFGFGLRPVDEQTLSSNELDFYYGTVLPQMEHLKDMGVTLPTTQDLTATLGTTDTVLSSLGIISSADKFQPEGG